MSNPTLAELLEVIKERTRISEYDKLLKGIEDDLRLELKTPPLNVPRQRLPTAGSTMEKEPRREHQLDLKYPVWRESWNSQ